MKRLKTLTLYTRGHKITKYRKMLNVTKYCYNETHWLSMEGYVGDYLVVSDFLMFMNNNNFVTIATMYFLFLLLQYIFVKVSIWKFLLRQVIQSCHKFIERKEINIFAVNDAVTFVCVQSHLVWRIWQHSH
jgi:hypothetical protein